MLPFALIRAVTWHHATEQGLHAAPCSGLQCSVGNKWWCICLPVTANGEGIRSNDRCGPQKQRLGPDVTRRQGVCCAGAAEKERPHCVSIPLRHLLSINPAQA